MCDFIVETHSDPDRGSTVEAVLSIFEGTHDVTLLAQEPRDWRDFPELACLGQLDRFLTQWEGRGPEPWIVATARSRGD